MTKKGVAFKRLAVLLHFVLRQPMFGSNHKLSGQGERDREERGERGERGREGGEEEREKPLSNLFLPLS